MSDYQVRYDAAKAEYGKKVRVAALSSLPALAFAVFAQFKWSGSIGTILLAFAAAGWGFGYQFWQRKLWKRLQVKHGLINA